MDNSLSEVPPGSYQIIFKIIGFGILLCFSMLFSAAETAIVSLTANDVNEIKNSKERNFEKIANLITNRFEFLLVTLLLGNNLANVSIATIAALLARYLFLDTNFEILGMFFEVLIIGMIILLLGEIIPKSYSIRNKIQFVKKFSRPLVFFYYILYPLSYIIERIVNSFVGKLKNIDGISEYSRKDIENLMEVGGEDGVLEEDEKNMINSIFEFSEKSAKEIMVPRVD
ncbi:MAG: DUF21 domain-containing protein, partial [Candidatus Delongbacteria bacterium]|nr:DUF21 domain-containing protein [Candidatus Delongbacteria bacterium]